MTFAELDRLLDSKRRTLKIQEQKQASFDYVLADLIGRSVARVYNSANELPSISQAYPTLFDAQEMEDKVQEKKDELSALRFKQFAHSYNAKFKEVGKEV